MKSLRFRKGELKAKLKVTAHTQLAAIEAEKHTALNVSRLN
jgi:hypothetical protein